MASLDDLKGGKWRTASFWHLDFLKNANATPVTMHWGPEIPKALQAGTLDGLMVNIDSGYMLNVHESAPHVLISKDLWLGHVYILAMNKDVWNSFRSRTERLSATVRVLGTEEVAQFETITNYKVVQTAWAERQHREGIEDAGSVITDVTAIMEDMTG